MCQMGGKSPVIGSESMHVRLTCMNCEVTETVRKRLQRKATPTVGRNERDAIDGGKHARSGASQHNPVFLSKGSVRVR